MRSLPTPAGTGALSNARASNPYGPWNGLGTDDRRSLRNDLVQNQDKVCVWCQKQIGLDTSHIDHIRSQNSRSDLTFHCGNLAASCNAPNTCGHGRQRKGELPEWVHPYETEDLESNFEYAPDGGIRAASGVLEPRTSEATRAVDEQLNLNERTLKERREKQMAEVRAYSGQGFTVDEVVSFFPSFPILTQQVLS